MEKVRRRNDLSWMENGILEVFPHASFSTLVGQLLQNKNTAEGLNQRWLLLQELGMSN